MRILRRRRIKKHLNTIIYTSIFTAVTLVVSVAAVNGRDKTEFVESQETETYVVDVVSKERVNLAVVEAENGVVETTAEETTLIEEATTVAEATQEVTTEDLSSYEGIFVMNTSGNLNIRSKGDTEAEVVGVLVEGNGGNVLEYGTEWTKVESGNVKGYVATEYILIGDKAEKAIQENGYVATVNTDTLLVRSKRSTESSVLGMAANGSEYKCTKVYPKWVKISYKGKTGYVSREFVKLESVMTYAKTVEEIESEQTTQAPETEASVAQQPKLSQPSGQSVSVQSSNTSSSNAPATESRPEVEASYDDSYLLACLVTCEAGGESYEGKLAVANVVLNRVASSVYPSTIKGVIYQSSQFGPATNGSLARVLRSGPDSGSTKAAKAALAGTNNVPGYLFFGRTGSINTKNLKSYKIIDNQIYY